MKRTLVTTLHLLVPCVGGAQETTPGQRIEAARRRALAAGVPVVLLDMKIAEGRAKGIAMERIAIAVENRLALLAQSREIMAGVNSVTAADLSAAADALAAGVSPNVLSALARAVARDQRSVAVAVLAQLVREGETSDRAAERVRLALGNPALLRTLPGEVQPPMPERTRPGMADAGVAAGEEENGTTKRPRRP